MPFCFGKYFVRCILAYAELPGFPTTNNTAKYQGIGTLIWLFIFEWVISYQHRTSKKTESVNAYRLVSFLSRD